MPPGIESRIQACERLLEEGMLQEAAREYQLVSAEYPREARGFRGLGAALFALRRYREAVSALLRATTIIYRDSETWGLLGKAAYYDGDLERAVHGWREALRFDPRYFAKHSGEKPL